VVENFLYVSRCEASHSDLLAESTSLTSLLRKIVAGIQEQTTQHVIKLRLPHSLPSLKIDRQKIEQLMANLLANAVKYSPEGGDIAVSAKPVWDEDELAAHETGAISLKPPCVIVAVQDSGMGIAEDELERVFDKYYRANNRLTRATSGAGLGLYICKAIVQAHGGHIWATSAVGRGSTFKFSLPLDHSAPREQQ
jgi:signal transduction histidine kinase